MPLLTETFFLQNTGRVLLASLLQFSVLYLVYVFLKNTLLKKISARTDFLLLLVLLVSGTAVFVYSLANSFSPGAPAGLSFIVQNQGWYTLLSPVLHWLAAVYIIFAAFRVLVLIRTAVLPLHKKYWEPARFSTDFTEYLETFCSAIRLKVPRMVFSPKALTPFVTGVFHSVIVIPASFQSQFTPQEMEAVILHEIAHIKRYDLLVNLLVICCAQLLFFNPFAGLLLRRLRLQRELACDDWVLAQDVHPKHYATALYKTAQQQLVPAWQLAMSARNGELYQRIERLFSHNKHKHPFRLRLAPFAVLVLCTPLLLKQPASLPVQNLPQNTLVQTEQPVAPVRNNIAASVPKNNSPAPPASTRQTAKPVKRVPNKPATAKPGQNTPVYEEYIVAEQVSNKTAYLPIVAYSSNGIKRSGDIVVRYTDSVNLFTESISRTQIEEITSAQLESMLNWLAQGINNSIDQSNATLVIESPQVKINVTTGGEKNLYFAHTMLNQKTQYDAYFRQWKIQFTITNGDQQLGSRYITIYQKKKLEATRL